MNTDLINYYNFLKTLDIPNGYNYIAMDSSGKISAFTQCPDQSNFFGYTNGGDTCFIGWHDSFISWYDSLISISELRNMNIPNIKYDVIFINK